MRVRELRVALLSNSPVCRILTSKPGYQLLLLAGCFVENFRVLSYVFIV